MTLKTLHLMFAASITLAGCQTSTPLQSNPENIIYNSSVKNVTNALANSCVNNLLFVEAQTENTVLCSSEANDAAQLWFGTRYGSGVFAKAQFNIIQVRDNAIKVVGRGWFENQNAYGATKRNYVDRGMMPSQIQSMIDDVKTKLEGK